VTKTTVSSIVYWSEGTMTSASLENNKLIINNGSRPQLLYEDKSVVRDITKEVTTNAE